MCRQLGVRSSFYAWRVQAATETATAARPAVGRAHRRTTVAGEQPVESPDLIGRDFTAGGPPGTRLVGDITYLRTGDGWLFLATVIDLATRMVIGWQSADHMRTSLVTDAPPPPQPGPGSPSPSTSRSSTTAIDCTQPLATAPPPKPSPTTTAAPRPNHPEDLSRILDTPQADQALGWSARSRWPVAAGSGGPAGVGGWCRVRAGRRAGRGRRPVLRPCRRCRAGRRCRCRR
jgi:Integrase core domain